MAICIRPQTLGSRLLELVRACGQLAAARCRVQSAQIGHPFETRGRTWEYITLRYRTVTLDLSGLRAAPQRSARREMPADACALASGSGVVAVHSVVVVQERKCKDALEDAV